MEPKLLLAVFCVCAVVDCRPQDYANAKIIRNDFSLDNEGNFDFSVDTSDGFRHSAIGYTNNIGTKDESLVFRGWYSYTAPNGLLYKVFYVADKDGFRPFGDHIPQFKVPSHKQVAYSGLACVAASLCGTGLG